MKILIIAPYYYPYINARAYRWTQIAEQWAAQGNEVFVLTSKHEAYEEISQLNSVCVHRVGYNSAKEWLFQYLPNRQKIGQVAKQPKPSAKPSKLISVLDWLNRQLQYLFFPDNAFMWQESATRRARQLIQLEGITRIVSVALPFTAHAIGLSLKKEFSNLKWLCDYGDPYYYQIESGHFRTLFGKKAKRLEQAITKYCDSISVTTLGTQKIYLESFNLNKDKVKVIPPMANHLKAVPQRGHSLNLAKNKIHLGYFGSFYAQVREPWALLQALARLQNEFPADFSKVELHFFGDIFPQFLQQFEQFSGLRNQITLHGLVSRTEVNQAMKAMDGLINIGNTTDYQLASKSVDYLQSGKPILNFCAIANDSFSVFAGTQSHIMHWQAHKANSAEVMAFIIEMPVTKVESSKLDQYSPTSIAEQYWQLLQG